MHPILKRISVKPKSGVKVIDPETNMPIPEDGADVLDNKYMRRRILDGDLIETEASKKSNK